MTPENFVYWLNGFLELSPCAGINENQIKIIQNHLDLVLKKVTPKNADQQAPLPWNKDHPMWPFAGSTGINPNPDQRIYC